MIKSPAKVLELPLEQRAMMALEAAVEGVIEEHVNEGLRLYIWQNEKVIAVPPEELPPLLNALISKRTIYPK